MRFLVDESTGKKLANLLEQAGHDVVFVGDIMPGIANGKVLTKAERANRILITDDKDFGELLFRLKKPSKGIVFLRTDTTSPEKRFELLDDILKKYEIEGKFIIVKEGRIRIRKLKH